jgi:hypothetical protein
MRLALFTPVTYLYVPLEIYLWNTLILEDTQA